MKGALHFVGIGGIGMSAIARILMTRGDRISGSDLQQSRLTEQLRAGGVRITIGHRAKNIDGARAVVISSAIGPENPEFVAAGERGLPIYRRGEMLAHLMRGRRGIAIAGTHGKTTTTAMAAAVLSGAGLDPTVLIGGEAIEWGSNARDGSGAWFLTEADESDGSFMELVPEIALVTNIENDHIASDEELPRLRSAFAGFLRRLPADGVAVIGVDNKESAALARLSRVARTLTFGLSERADVHAKDARYERFGSTFDVIAAKKRIGNVRLRVPGEINVFNALGAIAIGLTLDVPFAAMAEALSHFAGVRRRFEILARTPRLSVVDDYAHHPTEVKATIAAARAYHDGQVIVAFQPHRYTRTAYLAHEFADALRGAQAVFLTPVYAASENPIDGVSERSIGEPLQALGTEVHYIKRLDQLPQRILEAASPGALVLMLGAGDITQYAAVLASQVQERTPVIA
ncbi:MAG: UDP-N-acetylmuramate--L-alanine ligase [Candidatus Eremiobacteraeota bacterium]|nr:UDP-N-acetylmuramate--L-alanine ligase [Candidatus Eremiobacteraeota bacterium]